MSSPPDDPLAPQHPIGLRSSIVSMGGLFSQALVLRAPRYQRPYSWTDHDVGRLITDLRLAFLRDAPFYFIGHLVFVRTGPREYEIVDGQQRLATLTILLAFARDELVRPDLQALIAAPSGLDGAPRFRLRLRPADDRFFAIHVQTPGGMGGLTAFDEAAEDKDADPYADRLAPTAHGLIIDAAQTCARALEDMTAQELSRFVDFVRRRATFDLIEADERGGAATLFRVTNDRGRDLSAADVLKCEILEGAALEEAQAEAAALEWEAQEAALGRDQFARLLALMPVIVTGEPIRAPGDLSVFRTHVIERIRPADFLKDVLPRHGAALRDLLAADVRLGSAGIDINRRLKCLLQLDEDHWLGPAVCFLATQRGAPERARRFFQALDRLAFACFLGIIRPKDREERFARAIAAIQDDRRLFGPGGALELTVAEHRDLQARLNRPFKRDAWVRRVVAMRVNAAIPGGEVLRLTEDVTVEHILPVRGGAWWAATFPDQAARDTHAHLIGNWALVTSAQNGRAADKPFEAKKRIYFETPDAPLRAMTRDIADYSSWAAEQIMARHERLVRLLLADMDMLQRAA